MDTNQYYGILVTLATIVSLIINFYFNNRVKTEEVKKSIMALFLFAQKQDWINEKKMQWCIDQVLNNFPIKYQKVIGLYVKDYLENVYKEYKKELETTETQEG